MALPLSIGGAFVGLVITNGIVNAFVIGFIMLMGIAELHLARGYRSLRKIADWHALRRLWALAANARDRLL